MLGSMPLWDALAGLRVGLDDYTLERRELEVRAGFTRVSTSVIGTGDGQRGDGEDITYVAEEHDDFPNDLILAGTWTLEDLSLHLDEQEIGGGEYRLWAFESAALH